MNIPFGADLVDEFVGKLAREEGGGLIGRFGTIECEVLYGLRVQPGAIGQRYRERLEKHAGIFPSTGSSVRVWGEMCRFAYGSADILATGWYAPMVKMEKELLEEYGFKGKEVSLRALEPYYAPQDLRWTRWLAGKRVCIVSSFAKSIEAQVKKGEELIWPGAQGSFWPAGVKWSFVRTGYPPCLAQGRAGWDDSPESWEDALEDTLASVLVQEPDIVLIGCGGLGMLLGAEIKKAGKLAIVLGGAIQVLFGICGERWANHEIISRFWNSAWVWPSLEETPAAANDIEGACYWKRQG